MLEIVQGPKDAIVTTAKSTQNGLKGWKVTNNCDVYAYVYDLTDSISLVANGPKGERFSIDINRDFVRALAAEVVRHERSKEGQ